jgi:hypothetical protein
MLGQSTVTMATCWFGYRRSYGIEGGAIPPEGQKFAQDVVGVPPLRKRYWGSTYVPIGIKARGYLVASSGNMTDEVWKKYIEEQKPDELDDDFSVL